MFVGFCMSFRPTRDHFLTKYYVFVFIAEMQIYCGGWDFHSDKCSDCGPLGYDTVLSGNSQTKLPSPSLGSKYTNRTHTTTIAVVWRKYLIRSPGSSEPREMFVRFNIREINLYVSSETSGTTTPTASRCHVTGDGTFGYPAVKTSNLAQH